jgi:hypothetical protein
MRRRLQPVSTMQRSATPLTDEQLRAWAPSVFATQPWSGMSDKYRFIPTIDVVNAMRKEGFQPVAASQSRTRVEGKQDYTKHMIRFRDFRHGDGPAIRELGQLYPELVVTNAHDGGSTYNLDKGFLRLVCLNGLVLPAGDDQTVAKVPHRGNVGDVIEATYEIIEEFPKVIDSVKTFGQLQLTAPQQEAFGAAALELKYDEENPAPFDVKTLLQPKRYDDQAPTLWNTYNVVQEKLTQGGIRSRVKSDSTRSGFRRTTTRPVNGISENIRLNKALWTLAEKLRETLQG